MCKLLLQVHALCTMYKYPFDPVKLQCKLYRRPWLAVWPIELGRVYNYGTSWCRVIGLLHGGSVGIPTHTIQIRIWIYSLSIYIVNALYRCHYA